MKYEDILPISREELREALTSDSDERAARAIIATALHDTDWAWAEQQCLMALQDRREDVRAAAIIGLGHIARVHRRSTLSVTIPALKALRFDQHLGGTVEDAIEDILMFVRANG
ncbi:MAG TPA: hypothetical protein VKP61_09800 [Candidatus Acidoferrum sp.]|nr:hypothetical protein [Candidatus Acidoferrum sp.]